MSVFHPEFPAEARDMWDIMAKALMLRAGGSVVITQDELRQAAATQGEMALDPVNKSIIFRVQRQ